MSTAKLIEFPKVQTFEDGSFDANRPVLVEPGEYEFILDKTWKGYLYGKAPKLILTFVIASSGPNYGVKLYRCYNIKGLTKRGEIVPKGWHSDLVREYSVLFGQPEKLRDICVSKFKGKVLKGKVRTVKKDSKQKSLPEELHYSVIDKLTGVLTE